MSEPSAPKTVQIPSPTASHERLQVFIGTWHAEGESYAVGQTKQDPRGSIEKWVSDETYAWLPGQFFVIQNWDAKTGANPFKGTAIISYDADTGNYTTRSYENHGFVRDYVTTVDGDIWTFEGDTERARLEFASGGNTQTIGWEWRTPGEAWLPLCDRIATRRDSFPSSIAPANRAAVQSGDPKDRGNRLTTLEDNAEIVRACFKSYVDKDRAKLESLIGEDFHFTSPLDNRIDRKTYFERCWPNSETMAAVDFTRIVADGDTVFVTYETRMNDGKRFKNTEVFTVESGKVTDVEVYFGWSIPHEAPAGDFVAAK
jgi:ketosteroid isomerase-like protein